LTHLVGAPPIGSVPLDLFETTWLLTGFRILIAELPYAMKLFDVTRPIHEGMIVYEGDPRVIVRRVASVTAGASANVSEVHLGSHTGTHVDPPLHFRDGAPGVDELSLEILIGPARLYALEARGPIDAVNLRGLDLAVCPRVLFKTRTAGERPEAGGLPAHGGLTAEAPGW
jgi:kynurenine formamidase